MKKRRKSALWNAKYRLAHVHGNIMASSVGTQAEDYIENFGDLSCPSGENGASVAIN
jgi:hypothetical protein